MNDILKTMDLEEEIIIELFDLLIKRSKYGVKSETEIILYEMGFNDRNIVRRIKDDIGVIGSKKRTVISCLNIFKEEVNRLLTEYPSIYEETFKRYI